MFFQHPESISGTVTDRGDTNLCFHPLTVIELDPTDLSIADVQIRYFFCKTEASTHLFDLFPQRCHDPDQLICTEMRFLFI